MDRERVGHLVEEIVQRLVIASSPEKVILFGSYARGEPDEDSDLDLLVIMDTTLPPLDRAIVLRRVIGPVDIPVDVFAMTPEEFEETRGVVGGLAYTPAKYGQIVYEKS